MLAFTAQIVLEGAKKRGDLRNRRITVPVQVATKLTELGCTFPGWLHLHVDGTDIFAPARRPPSRTSVDVTLPSWRFGKLEAGTIVNVLAGPATAQRAKPSKHTLDWLPYVAQVDGDYFPVDAAGTLTLWNKHSEPFAMKRLPDDEEAYWWLLGFYQAEGSKGDTAVDFHVANTNPGLLRKMIAAIETWGIDRTRMYMGVLHRSETLAAPAIGMFEPLGVEITYVRAVPKNDETGILHVYRSMPLMRLVRERLRDVFEQSFPSRPAALAYANGWLDGDGGITRRGGSDDLVLSGGEAEHAVVKHALSLAFGWTFERGSYHKNTNEGTRITLRAHEMLDLLDARIFASSMNRVRLLLAFGDRTEKLAAGFRVGAFVRWGLVDSDGNPTALGTRILTGCDRYERAIQTARHLHATRPELFGEKCLPYPPEMDNA